MSGIFICILPSLTCRDELFHQTVVNPIITCHHFQAVRLIIIATQNDFNIAAGERLFVFILDIAGI